jgi:hypothetical protein
LTENGISRRAPWGAELASLVVTGTVVSPAPVAVAPSWLPRPMAAAPARDEGLPGAAVPMSRARGAAGR